MRWARVRANVWASVQVVKRAAEQGRGRNSRGRESERASEYVTSREWASAQTSGQTFEWLGKLTCVLSVNMQADGYAHE